MRQLRIELSKIILSCLNQRNIFNEFICSADKFSWHVMMMKQLQKKKKKGKQKIMSE
jgi:hypothetical protein